MAWATLEQVIGITGIEVSEETIAQASAMIDTFTGADEEMPEDAISVKDRKHLRKATAWQAIWIPTKPGLLTDRENFKRVSSDTQTVERQDRADGFLAPMARREIMNLSWVGTRSEFVPPRVAAPPNIDFLNERSDVYGVWEPL